MMGLPIPYRKPYYLTREVTVDRQQMQVMIEQHIAAEIAADTTAAVAMYTDDVIHDVVGSPSGPLQGPQAAKGFYDVLTEDLQTDAMTPVHEWYGENFAVIEHLCNARATGAFMGIPGHGREIEFRILHVWEFKDDAISRENIWLDSAAIIAQLAPAPVQSEPAAV